MLKSILFSAFTIHVGSICRAIGNRIE